ncbi:MAG: Taurine dioxygenase [Hyphomicrobiales bacterium]|nr:Taurine dioxygenase [Hyphomicrobiales bacterium]
MPISVHPLSPSIGAEIRGVDISKPLDPKDVAVMRQAWLDHCVLLFRDQPLDAEQQRTFVRAFGELGGRKVRLEPTNYKRPEGPDYNADAMLVSNIREDGKPIGVLPDGEMWFHHDMCYSAEPNRASFLYSIEVPSWGGNTMFSSMYAAYENLPQSLKDRIEGRTVLQAFDEYQDRRVDFSERPLDSVPHCFQPIVLRHPETGKRAIYVSRLMSHRIEGLTEAESEALLEELFAYTEDPAIRYEHVWRPGDLLMWDNLCSTHARTDFPREERRLMRRYTLAGEPVIPAWDQRTAA